MSSRKGDDDRQLALVPVGPRARELAPATSPPAATAALEGEVLDVDARPLARLSPADDNPASVYLAQLAASSARTMRGALSVIASILTDGREREPTRILWGAVRYEHAQRVRAELVRRYEPATVNRHLAAFRRVMREAFHLRQLSHELYAAAVRISDVEHDAPPAGRALPESEIFALYDRAAARPHATGAARDAAIFACMYPGGLRRDEIRKLDVASYNRSTGELAIDGKRKRRRLVPFEGGAREALEGWLELRGDAPGPLFSWISRSGRILGRRLSGHGIAVILKARAREAKLDETACHDLRRTTATLMYERGVDGSTVSAHLGHADEKTTRRYNRQLEGAKRRAVSRLHVPFRRPTV